MKELDLTKKFEFKLNGKSYPAQLIYKSIFNNDELPYVFAVQDIENKKEFGVWTDKYGRHPKNKGCFIVNIEEKVKFDPRKPVKFAKNGARFNPIFIKEIDNKKTPYVFEYKYGDGEENEDHVWSFTPSGFMYSFEEKKQLEKDEYDLINYEPDVSKFDPRKPVKFAKEGRFTDPVFIGEIENDDKYSYVFGYKHNGKKGYDSFTEDGFCYTGYDIDKDEKKSYDLINYEPEKEKFDPRARVKFAHDGLWSEPVFVGETGDSNYPYIFKYKYKGKDASNLFTENGFCQIFNDRNKDEKSPYDLINY